MIRIGVVNIDVSHPKAFAALLQAGQRARYVAVYNDGFRGDDEVDAFVEKFHLERKCRTVEELADCVDVGFIQGCNWGKHLDYAGAFFRRGKPVFIDKPIVGSAADCRRLLELDRDGHVILGSSSLRYAREISEFLAKPVSERGRIMHVYGTCGVDEFNYGIHIVESICGLVGGVSESVQFANRAVHDGKWCETFCLRFADGTTATYNTFQGTWMPCVLVVMTTTGTFHFQVDMGKVYQALLDRICDSLETGKRRTARPEELVDAIRIMLAGRLSRERGGAPVRTAEIPDDDPGYDGDLFEKGYAAAAKKIYLE